MTLHNNLFNISTDSFDSQAFNSFGKVTTNKYGIIQIVGL